MKTPFYVYDRDAIKSNIQRLKRNFASCKAGIYYAIKANTSIALLQVIKNSGIGAEVVSPGEAFIALKAGFNPRRVLYNNIARREQDVKYALRNGIIYYNFEALDQAELLETCARSTRKKIKLFARINPGIFPDTHPHLSTGAPSSKFGMEVDQLKAIVKLVRRFEYASLVGLHSHIGSQILTPEPFVRNVHMVASLIDFFRRHKVTLKCVNLGGGFGIPYHQREKPLDYAPIVKAYLDLAQSYCVKIMLEPGRSIVGNAGYIACRIISVKKRHRQFLYIIDAGMTENPRPALYEAYHHIEFIGRQRHGKHRVRIAGPLCENSDEFGTYVLPRLQLGDTLLIQNCGAYTRTMASNYNGRLLPGEYLIRNDALFMIRKAQRYQSLIHNEIY